MFWNTLPSQCKSLPIAVKIVSSGGFSSLGLVVDPWFAGNDLGSPERPQQAHLFSKGSTADALSDKASVLDLVGMRAGEPTGRAIARSVDLAQHVEQCGYQHSISGLACSATPALRTSHPGAFIRHLTFRP
jgi:hypothetical protein